MQRNRVESDWPRSGDSYSPRRHGPFRSPTRSVGSRFAYRRAQYSRSLSEKTAYPGSKKRREQSVPGGRVRSGNGSSPQNIGGLVVGLNSGRRIEVNRGFDATTLERLLMVLDKV
jgi:hypothetical protein